jgi:putative SOS response-associated peptidase YedK
MMLAVIEQYDSPFVFVGLWEGWKDPANDEIIAGEPYELVAQIHIRMPVILSEEDHAKWLGQAADGELKAFLNPFLTDQMGI